MNGAAVRAGFQRATGHPAEVAVLAPGRVNLIGEHTDYNEGFVLPVAIDRGVAVASRRVSGDRFTLLGIDVGDVCTFAKGALERTAEHSWADYFKGVVWALNRRGFDVPVCEAVVTGDIPRGAGLSSSAAYEVATVLALNALGGFELSGLQVAELAREAESGFVGVACGIMDQMACMFGEPGSALLLDCRSLERQLVTVPTGLKLVVVGSGVCHCLANSEYNQRRDECNEGVRLLSVSLPHISSLRDVLPEDLNRMLPTLPPVVGKRCRHVVSENCRVHRTVTALGSGDRAELRALMVESHRSLRDDYQVSCPELDVLVELAMSQPFCHGARLTGAGFGGSTVNLVEAGAVPDFTNAMASGYKERSGRTAEIHVFEPSAGARVL